MTEKQEYFISLISQFYQNATKNHSKKITLQKKYTQFLNPPTKNPNKRIKLKSQQKFTLNKISSKNLLTTANLSGQSNGTHSQKSQSQSSETLKNQNMVTLFQSKSFSKSVIFSYFNLLINFNETETLINLKESFFIYYRTVLEQSELQRANYYWERIIFLSRNKKQDWFLTFSQYFKSFSSQFFDRVFIMITNIDGKKLKYGMINKDIIKNMSQCFEVGVNYFCLNKYSMMFRIEQNQQFQKMINIVLIKQRQKFIVVKEPLRNYSQFQAVQKLTVTLGQSIKKIIQNYQGDNIFGSSQNVSKSKERQQVDRKNMFNFKSQNNILKLKVPSHI